MRGRRAGMSRRSWALGKDIYSHIEEGYDALAPRYDVEIGSNLVGQRMHAVFRTALERRFVRGDRVFEIGCGTGIDALWLALRGIEVVATDLSERMLAQLARKAKAEGVDDRVHVCKLAARDIGRLETDWGPGSFAGGYCHAGALNMEPALASVPAQLRRLLRPSGHFVCSVVNKTSLFEVLFYPLVLRPRKAFRRLDNVVPIPITREGPMRSYVIPSRFYSPGEMIRLFDGGFAIEEVRALQALLPPSNLTNMYERLLPAFLPFQALEDRFATRRPLNTLGHHTILTFRRI